MSNCPNSIYLDVFIFVFKPTKYPAKNDSFGTIKKSFFRIGPSSNNYFQFYVVMFLKVQFTCILFLYMYCWENRHRPHFLGTSIDISI